MIKIEPLFVHSLLRTQTTETTTRQNCELKKILFVNKMLYALQYSVWISFISLGILGTTCPGQTKFSNKDNPICKYVMTSIFHEGWMQATAWFVFIPMFVVSIFIFLLNARYFSRWARFQNTGKGDPNMKLWSFIFLVCPTMYIIIDAVMNFKMEYDESSLNKRGAN